MKNYAQRCIQTNNTDLLTLSQKTEWQLTNECDAIAYILTESGWVCGFDLLTQSVYSYTVCVIGNFGATPESTFLVRKTSQNGWIRNQNHLEYGPKPQEHSGNHPF